MNIASSQVYDFCFEKATAKYDITEGVDYVPSYQVQEQIYEKQVKQSAKEEKNQKQHVQKTPDQQLKRLSKKAAEKERKSLKEKKLEIKNEARNFLYSIVKHITEFKLKERIQNSRIRTGCPENISDSSIITEEPSITSDSVEESQDDLRAHSQTHECISDYSGNHVDSIIHKQNSWSQEMRSQDSGFISQDMEENIVNVSENILHFEVNYSHTPIQYQQESSINQEELLVSHQQESPVNCQNQVLSSINYQQEPPITPDNLINCITTACYSRLMQILQNGISHTMKSNRKVFTADDFRTGCKFYDFENPFYNSAGSHLVHLLRKETAMRKKDGLY